MYADILNSLAIVLSPLNLTIVFLGCFAGTFIGLIPGLGPITALALILPLTYSFPPETSLIMMAAIYYGAVFGGSTSSILINAPGLPSTIATSFDGYPMAKQGHAGKALAIAAISSFIGGTVGAVLLLLAAPFFSKIAMNFQSKDYFILMLFALTSVSSFSGKGKILKALIMILLGMALGTVGTDSTTGIQRFTFGYLNLIDGFSFLMMVMVFFAISETLMGVLKNEDEKIKRGLEEKKTSNISSLKIPKEDIKDMAGPVARSSILGFIIGILPGAGGTIASLLAYSVEKTIAPFKDKKLFGKGSVRGLSAPEAANNADTAGAFIPMLTLGIPGSGTTAIILAALISYGIQPGPKLYVEHPEIFWTVILSMYIGNIILLILNLPLIPYIAKLLSIPKKILTPFIIYFSIIGVYLISFNSFDLKLMAFFAIIGLFLVYMNFPAAPLILGFILGEILEDNLIRAVNINENSFSFLYTNTFQIVMISLIILSFLPAFIKFFRRNKTTIR